MAEQHDRPLEQRLKAKQDERHFDADGLMKKKIKHVVVLMLENRGFDHFMGWLYEKDEFPSLNVIYPGTPTLKGVQKRDEDLGPFAGLSGIKDVDQWRYSYKYRDAIGKLHQPDGHGMKLRKGARASNVPTINPHEDFVHIMEDMYWDTPGPDPLRQEHLYEKMKTRATRDELIRENGSYRTPAMKGWVQNYCDSIMHHTSLRSFDDQLASQILDMYTPDQLPVMSFLARHYALSDLYFCSVPSQTTTNRAFVAAGTARGLVTNCFFNKRSWIDTHEDELPDNPRTIFEVLQKHLVKWRFYWHVGWPSGDKDPLDTYFAKMFPQFKSSWDLQTFFPKAEQFFRDAAKLGGLPDVAYIEPQWGGGEAWTYVERATHWRPGRSVGNEFHPVSDTTCGEYFVKRVYDAVTKGPNWESTLLVIVFDENGGTFDHLPPTRFKARPSGLDECEQEKVRRHKETWEPTSKDGKKGTQFGFPFDMYGVRVPFMLISPYIKPRTIFRSQGEYPFDHTSIISTILKWKNINPAEAGLGARVAVAPTFEGVLEGVDGFADGARPRDHETLGTHLKTRADGKAKGKTPERPLQCDEEVYLRYIGDWRHPYLGRVAYLGGPPVTRHSAFGIGGWWYPRLSTRENALKLKVVSGMDPHAGDLSSGHLVELVWVFTDPDTKKQQEYRLVVPEGVQNPQWASDLVYLDRSAKKYGWRIWLATDRMFPKPLYSGDQVFLFSDQYWPRNIETGATGYDPYVKLAAAADSYSLMDAYGPNLLVEHGLGVADAATGMDSAKVAPETVSEILLTFRAGEWDAWAIERASEPAPKPAQPPQPAAAAPKAAPAAPGSALKDEIRDLCAQIAASLANVERLRGALETKVAQYLAEVDKSKGQVDMDLLSEVEQAFVPAKEEAAKPKEPAGDEKTDGAAGVMTGTDGHANRVSCLAQVRNTCGVRAAYNCLVFAGVIKQESHADLWERAKVLAPDKEPFRIGHAVNITEDRVEKFLHAHGGRDVVVFSNHLYWDRMLSPANRPGSKDYLPPSAGVAWLKTFQENVAAWRRLKKADGAPALRMVLHTSADREVEKQTDIGHYFAVEITPISEGFSYRYRDSKVRPQDRNKLIEWFIGRYLGAAGEGGRKRISILLEGAEARPFKLEAGGETITGKLGPGGLLDQQVPAASDKIRLTVTTDGGDVVYRLDPADVAPISEPAGVQARLNALGYLAPSTGKMDDETAAAIAEFQEYEGLEPTGKLDDRTRALLDERFKEL